VTSDDTLNVRLAHDKTDSSSCAYAGDGVDNGRRATFGAGVAEG